MHLDMKFNYQNNLASKQQAMSFDEFVDSLFDFARDPSKTGLSVQMENGHLTRIDVIHVVGIVKIKMDDVEMGYFEEYDRQGYKCRFNQKHRVGIRGNLTPNEAMMKSICDNPLILFHGV